MLPKLQRAAPRRLRQGASFSASEVDTNEGEEDMETRLHKQALSEFVDIAIDPLLDTSEVGHAPVLWGTRPERSPDELIARFAKLAEREYKQFGREYAQAQHQVLREAFETQLGATTDEAERTQLQAQLAQLDAWLEQEIAASDADAEKGVATRYAQVAAEAEVIRDRDLALALRNGGSGLPHVAAEEVALGEVAAFAEGTVGEAYMRRMLPVLLRNSSITYADKQRALGIMLHKVAR